MYSTLFNWYYFEEFLASNTVFILNGAEKPTNTHKNMWNKKWVNITFKLLHSHDIITSNILSLYTHIIYSKSPKYICIPNPNIHTNHKLVEGVSMGKFIGS